MIKHLVTVPARRGCHGTQREGAVDWYQQELCPQGPAGRPPASLLLLTKPGWNPGAGKPVTSQPPGTELAGTHVGEAAGTRRNRDPPAPGACPSGYPSLCSRGGRWACIWGGPGAGPLLPQAGQAPCPRHV